MAGLEDLLQAFQDHQAKDPGTRLNAEVLLESWRQKELDDLRNQRDAIRREQGDSLAGADTAEIDQQIAEQEEAIRQATVTFRFRALSQPAYQTVLADHPESLPPINSPNAFLVDLAAKCYQGCRYKEQEFTAEQFPLDKARGFLTDGEFDPILQLVLTANRKDPKRPF